VGAATLLVYAQFLVGLVRGDHPQPEVMGLIGLMVLQESRRAARSSPDGDLILLDQQDRSLWNKDQIAAGISFTESALASRRFGAYTLQAAIAAVHAEVSSSASVSRPGLYEGLASDKEHFSV
jgi:predicted RNA polymerase sigma factor